MDLNMGFDWLGVICKWCGKPRYRHSKAQWHSHKHVKRGPYGKGYDIRQS